MSQKREIGSLAWTHHNEEKVMSNDLNVLSEGIFHVKRVSGGTYDNVVLHARSSGSIHVQGELTVHKSLTIICENSGTVLLPDRVTCDSLELNSVAHCNVNSNDLEVTSVCRARVTQASTASLYLKLKCDLTGSVTENSTMHTWINWPFGRKKVDVQVDSSSVFSERDWNG